MIDACVLYPTVMREVFLGCASNGLFEARWSLRILEEWARAAGKQSAADEIWARGEIARLGAMVPRATVHYEAALERQFWLPDTADIHVLAAAYAGSCDAILTMNTKDFPRDILSDAGVGRLDPDGFALQLLGDDPEAVNAVAQGVLDEANRLSDRVWTMRALMKKARMPRFGKALEMLEIKS